METIPLQTPTQELAIRRIQTIALKAIHDFFFTAGFEQLMPVILSPITDPLGPDPGSSVIKTGEIEYLGQKLQITQSMILHKQIAIGRGISRLYIISPNVRLESAEKIATGIHAFEFSQVDFEVKDAKMRDIFELVEQLLRTIRAFVEKYAAAELQALHRVIPRWQDKFPVFTSHELEDRYGSDWEKEASRQADVPYFVTCHAREFYDKLDRVRDGKHYLNYDLYYPEGFLEALSGGEREHEYPHIMTRIMENNLKIDKYTRYIELAKEEKIHPSAGGGLGVERLIRYLTGRKSIKEVQLFPRIPGTVIEV